MISQPASRSNQRGPRAFCSLAQFPITRHSNHSSTACNTPLDFGNDRVIPRTVRTDHLYRAPFRVNRLSLAFNNHHDFGEPVIAIETKGICRYRQIS